MLQLVFTRVSTRSLQRFLRPSTLRPNGVTPRLPFSPITKRFSSEIPTARPKPVGRPELATTPAAVPRPRTWNFPRKWRYPTAGIAITTGLVAGYGLNNILNEETGSNKLFSAEQRRYLREVYQRVGEGIAITTLCTWVFNRCIIGAVAMGLSTSSPLLFLGIGVASGLCTPSSSWRD